MRYALIADIHANLTAFTAVLDDIEHRGGVEEFWCLGDIVGYGPDPNQCIELLRKQKHICVVGNHDLAAIGKLSLADFNPDAASACRWTAQQLSPDDIEYLGGLPQVIERDDFTLVHGSPREPIWEYLVSAGSARESFAHFKTQFCLVGHSHFPLIFRQDEDGNCSFIPWAATIGQVLGKSRMIINPGGIGQPRDSDPRASYAIYDSESKVVRLYRVPYDINATQVRMTRHNLPMRLVVRLEHGV
jgi:diadenosine tetraphosphatase ApaH/serine/threonine PP2A family protein phosphatase